MKTANEFIEEYPKDKNHVVTWQELMREFAKLHVKAAIQECIESAPSGSSTDTVSYEDVVEALTDCYPESNIK